VGNQFKSKLSNLKRNSLPF